MTADQAWKNLRMWQKYAAAKQLSTDSELASVKRGCETVLSAATLNAIYGLIQAQVSIIAGFTSPYA